MSEITKGPTPEMHQYTVGYDIAIGAAVGLLFALMFGNLIMGIALGSSTRPGRQRDGSVSVGGHPTPPLCLAQYSSRP